MSIIVHFGTWGRRHNVLPLRIKDAHLDLAWTPAGVGFLAGAIHGHVQPHLFTRDVTVAVDPEQRTGTIKAGTQTLCTFTLTEDE